MDDFKLSRDDNEREYNSGFSSTGFSGDGFTGGSGFNYNLQTLYSLQRENYS